ncbi:MAG: prephenate dehydratase [Candidatus Daviesbacteria bacterium]|nr:prephenate dehydratase [Candidatus Daviesbacteria bacterium]
MNKIELLINNYPVKIELTQGRIKPRVACLGPEGTYTEAARWELLGNYLDEMDAVFLPYNATVVQAVEAGDYDIGVVPVENAIEGDVVEVLRELNHTRRITILGETILGIQHMLIGWPGFEISEIHSHPQALAQCRTYLLNNYPQAKQEPSSSTTAAVELARNNKQIAAIAGRRAAQIYNVPILAEDIGDVKGNSTRFLMLGRGETKPTGQDSTALVFIVPESNRPGMLARCLTVLASYDINLTKIDSRPTGIMRQYAFWVTIDGHIENDTVKQGINDLETTYCSSLRILGSYRKAELPAGARDPGTINGQ